MPLVFETLAWLSAGTGAAASGVMNGFTYSKNRAPEYLTFYKNSKWADLHLWETILTTSWRAAAWFSGMGLVEVYAAWLIASPVFKGFINWSVGRRFVHSDEFAGSSGWALPSLGITVPQLWRGKGRLVQAALGVALFVAWKALGLPVLDAAFCFELATRAAAWLYHLI